MKNSNNRRFTKPVHSCHYVAMSSHYYAECLHRFFYSFSKIAILLLMQQDKITEESGRIKWQQNHSLTWYASICLFSRCSSSNKIALLEPLTVNALTAHIMFWYSFMHAIFSLTALTRRIISSTRLSPRTRCIDLQRVCIYLKQQILNHYHFQSETSAPAYPLQCILLRRSPCFWNKCNVINWAE